MKKIYLFVLVVVFGFSLSENCFAQEKVKLTYARPGFNQLYLSDLWAIELINLTNDQIEFYLYGTLSESKAGLIATGTTVSIKLAPKEKKKFKVNELPQTPDISYPNADQRFKDALMRKGKLPNGDYTICVYAKETGSNEEIGNDCLEHSVEVDQESEITLLTPENNSSIEPDEPIVFSWMDPSSKGPYKIKIVEIKGDESPENAMLQNKAFFEKEDIRTTMLQYPSSAPKFIEGKKYAWGVYYNNISSNIQTISRTKIHHISDKRKKQWSFRYCCNKEVNGSCMDYQNCKNENVNKNFLNRIIESNELKGKISNSNLKLSPQTIELVNVETKHKIFNSSNSENQFYFKNLERGVYTINSINNEPNPCIILDPSATTYDPTACLPFSTQIIVLDNNPTDSIPKRRVLWDNCVDGFLRETFLGGGAIVTSDWAYNSNGTRVTCASFIRDGGLNDLVLEFSNEDGSPLENIFNNNFVFEADNVRIVENSKEIVKIRRPYCSICKAPHNTSFNCLKTKNVFSNQNLNVTISDSKTNGQLVTLINFSGDEIATSTIVDNKVSFNNLKQGFYKLKFSEDYNPECLRFNNLENCLPKDVNIIISNNGGDSIDYPGIRIVRCRNNNLELWEVSPSETRCVGRIPFNCSNICSIVALDDGFVETNEFEKNITNILNNLNLDSVDYNTENVMMDNLNNLQFVTINPTSLNKKILDYFRNPCKCGGHMINCKYCKSAHCSCYDCYDDMPDPRK